jgi:transposase
VIAQKIDQVGRRDGNRGRFSRRLYRRRNVIERCIGWLKNCRRIGTRYEKLAVSFLGMLTVAIIQRIFKMQFSNRT